MRKIPDAYTATYEILLYTCSVYFGAINRITTHPVVLFYNLGTMTLKKLGVALDIFP